MNDKVVVLVIAAAIVAGTPILYGAVGEILAERSGVMNVGVEGMMLLGAVMGIVGTLATDNPWIGLVFAAVAGAGMGFLHACLAIGLRVNQVVSGLALVIVGTGLSGFVGQLPTPPLTQRPPVPGFGPIFSHGLADLPVIGPIIFHQDGVVFLSWLLVVGASIYLFRTRTGLAVRAVGEDPATADASGVRVNLVRYVHVLIGGALAGVGGAYLSVGLNGSWQDGITAGTGWIAFALVIFSGWRPGRALIGAYAFGGVSSLSFTLQLLGVRVPSNVLASLPFVMALLVLVFASASPRVRGNLSPPAALGVPYSRESR
jgi:general nucleoside transport system permease protein